MEVTPNHEAKPKHEIEDNPRWIDEDDTSISVEKRKQIMELLKQNDTLIDNLIAQRHELQQLQTEREQLLKLIDSER